MTEQAHPNLKVIKEFSRFAFNYEEYHMIQAKVAKYLIETLKKESKETIVDMGCGSGEVYKNLKSSSFVFKDFIAIDSSVEMLGLHPSLPHIEKRCQDFNKKDTFDGLSLGKNDLFISSSALQWSENLDFTFSEISKIAPHIHLALFTSNTFQTLHRYAKLSSPIYSESSLKESIQKYYDASFEIKKYRLTFKTTRELFRYIKKSGVSGGEKRLSFKESKWLLENYPLDYLEFEVLFIQGSSLFSD